MCLLPYEKLEFKIITLKQANTSPDYGKNIEDRTIEEKLEYGLINVDKPSGPTSHEISGMLKRILNIEKCGHSGTLDPAVTGILPIALNKGTKSLEFFLESGKEYVCLMRIHKKISEKKLVETIDKFVGRIKQKPPVKSAVVRKERYRTIYYIKILEIKGQNVLFKVGCQAGTYIRKLCYDIGEFLGCGANMVELRRTRVGPIRENTIHNLQEISDAYYFYKEKNDSFMLNKIILNIEECIDHIPKIWIVDSAVSSMINGIDLKSPGIAKLEHRFRKDDIVAVLTLKGELVCFGKALISSKEIKNNSNAIALKIEKVIMNQGIYPRMDK
ncbi:MAG: RNA-guided pseudouridylation complex pseudouridine synthase subunit Cbf5 [Candidatus Nanoarchaeia archaeon]|nr:RNA-guided pseudouridylation complex pseudouridine synthase subunit Cbf5 [Candidatus Nanoarchaeia archaeon]